MIGQSMWRDEATFDVREVGFPVWHRCPLFVARAGNLSAVALPKYKERVHTSHVDGLTYIRNVVKLESARSQAF